jgi:predicted RNA-binding Zn ribbon-like protein
MASARQNAFDLSGGSLCLDFANTVSGRIDPPEIERLRSYADFVVFARQSGAVDDDEADALLREGAGRPRDADAVLAQARVLREALFRIFFAVAHGDTPQADDLAVLNEALSRTLGRLRVVPTEHGYGWDWEHDETGLDRPLWPVVRDAAELLVSDERTSLRECAAETCAWLFLDRSKNQSRRWCDMKVCGNRTKVRRHYLKAKSRA